MTQRIYIVADDPNGPCLLTIHPQLAETVQASVPVPDHIDPVHIIHVVVTMLSWAQTEGGRTIALSVAEVMETIDETIDHDAALR